MGDDDDDDADDDADDDVGDVMRIVPLPLFSRLF